MNVLTEAYAALTPHLHPGEHILWAGRPKQGFALRALDLWVVPFMLCWLTGAVTTGVLELRQEGSDSLVYSIPFVLFGVWFLFSRFWFDAKLRGRTFYGLTDRRAIIVTYWLRQQIRSVYLKELIELQFTYRSDGTGTLEFFTSLGGFNRLRKMGYNRSSSWWPFSPRFLIPPAFEMIAEPRAVQKLILETKEKALKASELTSAS